MFHRRSNVRLRAIGNGGKPSSVLVVLMKAVTYLKGIRHGIWGKMERDPAIFRIDKDIGTLRRRV